MNNCDRMIDDNIILYISLNYRYHLPPNIPISCQTEIASTLRDSKDSFDDTILFNPQLYTMELSKEDKLKQKQFLSNTSCGDQSILENLTAADVRTLIRTEDEKATANNYELLFPTPDSSKYLKYFSKPTYYNCLLDAWERKYGRDDDTGIRLLQNLSQKKYHLK